MKSKTDVITFDQVSFSYETQNVLEQITLSIKKGDFVAVMGANGAGKSTLLKLLLGLLEPNKGKIKLFGEPLKTFKKWQKVGYLSQQGIGKNGYFPATCEEIVGANLFSQIGFLRFPKRGHKEQINKALELVGMKGYEKRLIYELSGGQQQRIMLAHVLISKPELIILDEPTTGVDGEAVKALYELLLSLNKKQGITIVMVTHDQNQIDNYVNRQIYLEDRTVLEA